MWLTLFLLLLLPALAHAAVARNDVNAPRARYMAIVCSLIAVTDPLSIGIRSTKKRAKHRQRKRKYVNDIFNDLGPYYVRRAYRMEPSSFWKLVRLLQPLLKTKPTRLQKSGAKNGLIAIPTRVSAAIRYFAGGSPYDIAAMHGISVSAVFDSV